MMTGSAMAITRIVLGIAQGLALYFLYRAFEAKAWPAMNGLVFAPLLLTTVFVPIIASAGLGNLRARTLIVWVVLAAALLSGLAIHDVTRAFSETTATFPRETPSPILWFFAAAGLFIAQSLVVAGDSDRRFIASYPRYFDVSWKHGVQLVLAVVFVGVFWALLWLGTELFRTIGLTFLAELIKRPWFAAPATTAMFACAIHVTDVRAGLVRGMRTLKLTLMAWLLPLMALLAAAFLLALPFTGLESLWHTRRATQVLLAAAAALVFLLNAAYQDGRPESPLPRVLRYAELLAAAALVPLVAISAYGLSLRVQQYGWTPDRIIVLACIVVAACYAAGYALAGALTGVSLRWVAATNVVTAFVILAVLLALFSPVADPARISVADQVARLQSGKVAPEQFDFSFLRFSAGRYGREALETLKANREGPRATDIAERAERALAQQNRYAARSPAAPSTPEERAKNITVRAGGTALPEAFLKQDWRDVPRQWQLPHCLTGARDCDAVMVDLDGDGAPEIVLFSAPSGNATAFKLVDATWTVLGTLANTGCAGMRDALRAGQVEAVTPTLKELEVAGNRMRVTTGCR
jgi:hypothetical protein